MFFATITTAGPAGQPDFADERYWAQAATGDILTAVNIGELFAGSHGLPAGQRVLVTENRFARPHLRYTFLCRPAIDTPRPDPTAGHQTATA